MIQTILTTILILAIPLILMCLIYLGIRNHKVLNFRLHLIRLQYEWSERYMTEIGLEQEEFAHIWFNYGKVSYDKMLYSFKPLKIEVWYDKKLVDKLLNT